MKTLVKERPIPFSPDMVLALLRGWKTQTSRCLLYTSDAADEL